jgi:high affinity Mn2+ porin
MAGSLTVAPAEYKLRGAFCFLGHFLGLGNHVNRIYEFIFKKRASRRDPMYVCLELILLLAAPAVPRALGQDVPAENAGQNSSNLAPPENEKWNLHFQSTVVGQGYPSFSAEYTGPNSLTPGAQIKDTVSGDVTGGVRLWRGGEFYADLVVWQGFGLSNTLGMAGFPNGEAFRIGKSYPDAYVCRAYLRETVGFGGEKEAADDAPDQLSGTRSVRRLTFTIGHLSAKDIFDTNAYSDDGRTQFMNWSLVANDAWDYPADTLGFTNGVAAELNSSAWTERVGIFMVSKIANGLRMDWNLTRAWSAVAEVERRHAPHGHPGALRLLAFDTRAHMGSYQEILDDPSLEQDIALTAAYRHKYGLGINVEQEIGSGLGAFARVGWSDGRNQTYEFTDVDRTASLGVSLKGAKWRRPQDTVGLAGVVNGIGAAHRQYLAAGGLGITVGDGALDYRSERIAETYYNWQVAKHFQLTLDYQFAQNPAYNHVRGPVDLFALRFHTEY